MLGSQKFRAAETESEKVLKEMDWEPIRVSFADCKGQDQGAADRRRSTNAVNEARHMQFDAQLLIFWLSIDKKSQIKSAVTGGAPICATVIQQAGGCMIKCEHALHAM